MTKPKYWKLMYYSFLSITVLLVSLDLAIFIIVPTDITVLNLVNNSRKFANLPAKYLLIAILSGGLSKDWFLGFYTYYSYRKWKDSK